MQANSRELILYLMDQPADKIWVLDEYKEKRHRSLDSNAYFHVLCDKLRQKLGISMAACKNHLIADYGQILYIEDGQPMIYKTNAPDDYMRELETIHSKCIKVTKENGKDVFFYRIYRGSHTYNSTEMAQLIKGTVEECKAQGIETATPAEIEQMQKLWEARYGKHNTDER